jgi:N-acetylglucosamine malate deacetylase 2
MHKNVLVVLAHPDDETFGSGGTIALYAQAGAKVTYVCATRGEMGRNMGMPFFTTREALADLRERELRDACQVLGVSDLRLLGIWDKTVEFVDPQLLTDRVTAIIVEVQPTLVITFYPGHAVHPDHNAIGAATIRAVTAMDPAGRPEVHAKAFGPTINQLGESFEVDVSSVQEIKDKALRAHRSQSEGMLASMEARFAKDPALREQMALQRTKEKYWVWKF